MPDNKKIHIVVNPAAGKPEPILSYLNHAFDRTAIDWDVTVSRRPGEVFEAVGGIAARGNVDVVAVYGGDGSIMEAARALYGSSVPLAILPGGTANVMAKELELPLDSEAAVRELLAGDTIVRKIDMGLINDVPFLIRVNMGILSDMIMETSDAMKDRWGQWAYGIAAFQNLPQEATVFELTIDGRTFTQEAVALTVTNAGNIGRKGYAFLPGISISDGLLDVIALDRADILSLIKVTGNMLLQHDSPLLKHWTGRAITIRSGGKLDFLRDDMADSASELRLSVAPAALNVLVPLKKDT